MALIAKDTGGMDRPLCPEGTHIARCVSLIDLGTQDDTYMGRPKVSAKIRVSWELPDERAVFSEDKGEQPFLVSKEYTVSLGSKANLRHDLEGWCGRKFTEEELQGFALNEIVGKPCMITVVHEPGKKDASKVYEKVTGVSALIKDPKTRKAIVIAKQENPSVVYEIEDGENDVFNSLPEWIQKKIRASHEFRGIGQKTGSGTGKHDPNEEDVDDLPF